jgi:hypothetical protein
MTACDAPDNSTLPIREKTSTVTPSAPEMAMMRQPAVAAEARA